MELLLALGIGMGAGLATLIALILVGRSGAKSGASRSIDRDATVFMFQGTRNVDMTPDAHRLVEAAQHLVETWVDLFDLFADRFPDMPKEPPGTASICPAVDNRHTRLRIEPDKEQTRVTLECTPPTPGELHVQFRNSTELDLLRTAMSSAPSPIWQADDDGNVFWHNKAYRDLCTKLDRDTDDISPFDTILPDTEEAQTMRIGVSGANEKKHWFEVTTKRCGDRALHFAVDMDAIVTAELAQRNFLQTLTKTFAHLPIGLAVFDKDRRLVLFNPALIDLTALPADFLSSRPNLPSFFDHMRENRMMPEPKNYKTWREQMAELTDAARDDRYSETWNLASGLTYKITGRPHPDGAVAFLLEDISAEISLTRRFRSELELSQSVLDSFDDAVAVFSQLGVLTFCNDAYRTLWRCDPDSAFAELSILDATRQWQQDCDPNPAWSDIRDFVLNMRERSGWDAKLHMRNGADLSCIVEPIAAGATLVRFVVLKQDAPQPALMIADARE